MVKPTTFSSLLLGGGCSIQVGRVASCFFKKVARLVALVAILPLVTSCGPIMTTTSGTTQIDMSAATTRIAILGAVDASLNLITSVDFGNARIYTTVEKTVSIGNIGKLGATDLSVDSSVPITAPFAFKGGSFPGTGGSCASAVSGGTICTLVLTFSPTSDASYSSTFKLKYSNGLVSMPIELTLKGKTLGRLTYTPPSSSVSYVNFDAQALNSTTTMLVTLSNPGSTALSSISVASDYTMSAPFTFTGGTYPGTSGTCSTTLEASTSATCTLQLSFQPTVAGAYGELLELAYSDSSSLRRLSIPLRGTTTGIAGWTIPRFQGPGDRTQINYTHLVDYFRLLR